MLRTRMGSCVYFCCHNILSFPQSAAKAPMVSALEFRCCRVIPLANHKLTFEGKRNQKYFHWKKALKNTLVNNALRLPKKSVTCKNT